MKASLPYIREQYLKYNELIFGGLLPPVEMRISHAERFLGKLEFVKIYGPFGRLRGYDGFVMKISDRRELSPEQLDDVIIHEMIHYHIAVNGIRDNSAHGKVFRSMMADINSRFGRNITISHKTSEQEKKEDLRIRQHIVCVSEMSGGELGVTVCCRTRVQEIMRKLPRYYRLKGMKWYISTDPYFNRFPRSISPKIYKAVREDLLKALTNSEALGQ